MTNTKGRQLSKEWVDATIEEMLNSPDPDVVATARFLQQNYSKIRTKFNVLGPDGVNRWYLKRRRK